ncbi:MULTISPECIES: hypothetical protein [Streptomyces]|uniref:hypothetical protein n=1 Tax=Streptomyces TaxID=1883 RepID=UPI0006F988FC|nr:hypothetical protein [Streptomyces sp. Root55]KQZ12140.1 hypothetical protein ASD51_33465 [Streptomyces sp. Root55]WRY86126.1 hypothetical protein OG388_35300 [Streptomyces clavifer]
MGRGHELLHLLMAHSAPSSHRLRQCPGSESDDHCFDGLRIRPGLAVAGQFLARDHTCTTGRMINHAACFEQDPVCHNALGVADCNQAAAHLLYGR